MISELEQKYIKNGLSSGDAKKSQDENGRNELPFKKENFLLGLFKRIWGPVPWILEVSLILEVILGKTIEAVIIFALLIFTACIGETQKIRTQKALNFLREKLRTYTRVNRDEKWINIFSTDIVKGDIIYLKTGDIVPADCTILDGSAQINESQVTGESVDVLKDTGKEIFSGSSISEGEIIAKVTAVGLSSYSGKTANLIKTAGSKGHLEKLLMNIIKFLGIMDAIVIVILVITTLILGRPIVPLLPFLVVLVVSTVPVVMPATFTVSNALEARILGKNGVLVTDLSAIQQASNMRVLCIDKTGTLTENKPKVYKIVSTDSRFSDKDILTFAYSCTNETSENTIDVAIINKFKTLKIDPPKILSKTIFNPKLKYSTSKVFNKGKTLDIIFGAPFTISNSCEEEIDALVKDGNRVVAVGIDENNKKKIIGLISFKDSPRSDSKKLVKKLKELGVHLLMITGDNKQTACKIAEEVGIGKNIGDLEDAKNPLKYNGFANIFPEDKYKIVKEIQDQNIITGMTGDGINDAPALKQADVGIAVSDSTDIAKNSAKVILTHDGLSDIVNIIIGGRKVYRRMLTWIITKLVRTIEMTMILTFSYLIFNDFALPLTSIILTVLMNDFVTMALATDNVKPSKKPENWDFKSMYKISGLISFFWLAYAFVGIFLALKVFNIPFEQVQSMSFAFIIFTAQFSIYLDRTKDSIFSIKPSKFLFIVTISNITLATLFAVFGFCMAKTNIFYLLVELATLFILALIIDRFKILFYKKTKIVQ